MGGEVEGLFLALSASYCSLALLSYNAVLTAMMAQAERISFLLDSVNATWLNALSHLALHLSRTMQK